MKSRKNLIGRFVIPVFLLIGLFAVSSTSILAQERDDDDKKANAKLAKQAKITMEQARATALQKVPGEIIEGELEKEEGKLIYSFDIRVSDGKIMEVWIDAKNGSVLRASEDTEDDDDKNKADDDDHGKMNGNKKDDDDEESEAVKKANFEKYSKQAKITMQQAEAIALQKVPGTIIDRDLEKEKGRLQYAFDIRDANGKLFDVEVDAKTGKILKAVEDTEDDEDN